MKTTIHFVHVDVQKSYGFDRAFNWASMKKISKFIFEKKIKSGIQDEEYRRIIMTHLETVEK